MRILTATLFMGVLPVSQSWASQPLDQLLACRQVSDAVARLDCFDRASEAAVAVKPSVAATSSVSPTSPVATKPSLAPSERATIESSIVRMSRPLVGRAEFTLENGQVWRQMDAENADSAKIGDRVVVTKKVLGAYWLKVEGGRAWRVTPVP